MRVLVSAASRHDATAEIAAAIGDVLRDRDHQVDVVRAEDVSAVDAYDAVVLGSAVYAGHWLEPARALVERHRAALISRPVWLFSSGPLGDPPKPDEDPVDVAAMREATDARDHQVFAGRLHRRSLGFAEKAIVLALRAPEGDFRDWDAIAAWSGSIADALEQ
jgi:menaquinone-dependent protoporphyrinogen oxidase